MRMVFASAAIGALTAMLVLGGAAHASPESEELSRDGLRQLQAGRTEDAVRVLIEATNVDPEDGHNYGAIHESWSGFGWSFDGTPQPKPEGTPSTLAGAINRSISRLDQTIPFSDGFERGDDTAWSPGSQVNIRVDTSVTDPAGNTLDR
jgi:hypothetical protein